MLNRTSVFFSQQEIIFRLYYLVPKYLVAAVLFRKPNLECVIINSEINEISTQAYSGEKTYGIILTTITLLFFSEFNSICSQVKSQD